jgi:hypothetical protein
MLSCETPEALHDDEPRFDESRMGGESYEYVCWMDVMGAESTMRRSTSIAANFVMKLHVAALDARAALGKNYDLYPVIDGLYACTSSQVDILEFIKNTFCRLALAFVNERKNIHRFVVRGGLAFGPVAKGRDMTKCSPTLTGNVPYCDRILLGMPMTQAFRVANNAAPFGMYIHESARAFAPANTGVIRGTHWQWWRYYPGPDTVSLAGLLRNALGVYFKWCGLHQTTILYEPERMDAHMKLMQEYFRDL